MTRPTFPRPPGLLAVAAVIALVAACGGSVSTGAPSTGAPATGAPSTGAPSTAAPGASGLPGFSFELPSEDKALEDVIPDEIGGEAVLKSSMTGGGSLPSEDVEAMLNKLGKTATDMSAAFGGNSKASIIAFRVKGADANALFTAFRDAADPDDVAQISDITVSGKSARKVVSADASTTTYIYVQGDTLVTVSTLTGDVDPAILNEIFSKLP